MPLIVDCSRGTHDEGKIPGVNWQQVTQVVSKNMGRGGRRGGRGDRASGELEVLEVVLMVVVVVMVMGGIWNARWKWREAGIDNNC